MLRSFNVLFLCNILLVTACYGGTNSVVAVQDFVIILQDGLNVRSAPNTGSKILETLSAGDSIKVNDKKVKGKTDYWYKIKTKDGRDGWIFGGYVEKDHITTAKEKLNSSKESCLKSFKGVQDNLKQFREEVTDDSEKVAQLEKMSDEASSTILLFIDNKTEKYCKEQNVSSTTGKKVVIPVQSIDDFYKISVKINGTFSLDFILDTNSQEVVVPIDVITALMKNGTIKETDLVDDSSVVEDGMILLRKLEVNGHGVDDIECRIISEKNEARLGQSFLRKLGNFSLSFSSP